MNKRKNAIQAFIMGDEQAMEPENDAIIEQKPSKKIARNMTETFYNEFDDDEYGDAFDDPADEDDDVQEGGGKFHTSQHNKHKCCYICKSPGTNSMNCPLNPYSRHKSHKKHPNAKFV